MADKGDMKSWEFLLQKEGDRTWLPLENLTVEILEGRYRVVARTPCANEEVDIYVSFVSSEDDPPKRRIQQRSHAANDDGLLAILPFTPFRPGRWELRCRPHGSPGDVPQHWQSQIELQVLPQDNQVDDDDLFGWDRPDDNAPDSQVTAIDAVAPNEPALDDEPLANANEPAMPIAQPLSAETSPMDEPVAVEFDARSAAELDPATASDEDIQRLAAEMSQMMVESTDTAPVTSTAALGAEGGAVAAETEISHQPSAGFTGAVEMTPEPGLAREPGRELNVEGPGIAIALEKEVVMMDGDRRVAVNGQIVRPASPSASPTDALLPSDLLLTLELRDPSTTEIWASHRESFRQAMAPVSFSCELQLPTACRTQLFLGNVTLWQVNENGHLEHLISQDFNAMAAVDALLDHARQSDPVTANSSFQEGAVSNLQQQAASNFLVKKFGAKPNISKGNIQINTELLNLLKPKPLTAGDPVNDSSSPAENPSITARPVSNSRLELPRFGNARSVAIPLADSLADDLAQDLDANSGDELALDPAVFLGETLDAEVVNSAEVWDISSPADLGEDNPFVLPQDGSLGDLAPLSGPNQDEASGLGFLAEELGQTSALESGLADGTEPTDMPWEPTSLPTTGDLNDSAGLALASEPAMELADGGAPLVSQPGLAHEVVVDDEETIAPVKLAWMQPNPSEGGIDEDISVPVPELTVPDIELVKGETVRIQVRVAQEPARFCARVWLLDCQSRTLLGEPQWVTAFLPLGEDLMEANVDLVVPEGSIELQVEAIAVEPITQRESRKVSARRKVSLGSDSKDLENW